ncbi:MAG: glycosyltransferase family 39 protein [Lewinellaceae bacterium]|nr:glycosyltransferase family 39 protein [Lewinellaceae bacterium]
MRNYLRQLSLLFPRLLRTSMLFQPVVFDILGWALLCYLFLRYLNSNRNHYLLFFGIALGIFFLNKYLVLLFHSGPGARPGTYSCTQSPDAPHYLFCRRPCFAGYGAQPDLASGQRISGNQPHAGLTNKPVGQRAACRFFIGSAGHALYRPARVGARRLVPLEKQEFAPSDFFISRSRGHFAFAVVERKTLLQPGHLPGTHGRRRCILGKNCDKNANPGCAAGCHDRLAPAHGAIGYTFVCTAQNG